jgi:hypothetical protein
VVGSKHTGKTTGFQKWVLKFNPNKMPLVLHEKDEKWKGMNVEAIRIGRLNAKSALKEICYDRVVLVDDALNLTGNWAEKLLGLVSVNRDMNASFVVLLQGLGVLKERKDSLGVFDTVIFFKGSESCAFLVKSSRRISKEVEFVRKEIEKLQPREMLVFDKETNLYYKTTNDDVDLLDELLTKPLGKGQKLEVEKGSLKTHNNNYLRCESKKDIVKRLAMQGKDRDEILREAKISNAYLREVLSDLRRDGVDIPKIKAGRPRVLGVGGSG